MADIFISYSRKDRDFVERFEKALRDKGYDIWIDWEDIPLSSVWMAEIEAGIEGANTFIFVISPDSITSDVCRAELEHALKHNKRIVPILYREPKKSVSVTIYPALSALNWVFFRPTDEFLAAMDSVVNTLESDLDHIRMHTRVLVRALEWENKAHDSSLSLRGKDLQDAERWLKMCVGKEPHPTRRHYKYIMESRKAAKARQRMVIGASTVALITIFIGFFVALNQYQGRQAESDKRVTQQAIAEAEADASASLRLVEYSQDALDVYDMELALALALEAVAVDRTSDAAQVALGKASLAPMARVRVFRGQTGSIGAQAFDPDGMILATGSTDDVVILWDVATGNQLHSFDVPISRGGLIYFSPDGNVLATIAAENLSLWDVSTGVELCRLEAEYYLSSLAWSPDGSRLVTGGDGILTFWNTKSCVEEKHINVGEGVITGLKWGPQDFIISFRSDFPINASIYFFDIRNEVELRGFENLMIPRKNDLGGIYGYEGYIIDYKLLSDGKTLMVASDVGFSFYDFFTGELLEDMRQPDSRVYWAGISMDKTTIITISDTEVVLRDTITYAEILRLNWPDIYPLGPILSPNGRLLAFHTGYNDPVLFLIDLFPGLETTRFRTRDSGITSAVVSPDNKRILLGYEDGAVQLYDAVTGERLLHIEAHMSAITCLAFNWGGTRILSGSVDSTARLWDVETGQQLEMYDLNEGVRSVAFSPDGSLVAVGQGSGSVREDNSGYLMSTLTGERIAHFHHKESGTAPIDYLKFGPDGRILLVGTIKEDVSLWDVDSGQPFFYFEGHSRGELSPDGDRVITYSPGKTEVILWGVSSGREIHHFDTGTEKVVQAKFTQNGSKIVGLLSDSSIVFWDSTTFQSVFHFGGFAQKTSTHHILSSDSSLIASYEEDGEIRVTQVVDSLEDLSKWVYTYRQIRDLTCDEREVYGASRQCNDQQTPIPLSSLMPVSTTDFGYAVPPTSEMPTIEWSQLSSISTVTPIPTATLAPTTTPIFKREIRIGETVTGLLEAGEHHSWSFYGTAGQQVEISADSTSTSNITVRFDIYGPDGESWETYCRGSGIAFFTVSIKTCELPITGTYIVEIRAEYEDQRGEYRIDFK